MKLSFGYREYFDPILSVLRFIELFYVSIKISEIYGLAKMIRRKVPGFLHVYRNTSIVHSYPVIHAKSNRFLVENT